MIKCSILKFSLILPISVFTMLTINGTFKAVSASHIVGTQSENALTGGVGHLIRCLGNGFIPRTNCVGTNHNDTILGVNGPETIYDLAGNDLIEGFRDADVIYAGKGSDTVLGGEGSDQLFG